MTPEEVPGVIDAMVSTAPIGIAILDRDLRYQYINAHLAATNGSSVDETIGLTLADAVGDMAQVIAPHLHEVMATGQPGSMRSTGVLPAEPGRVRHFETHNRALHGDDGAVIGVACFVIEITAQAEA